MVFSIGSGKMGVMARLRPAVSISQIITEEVGSQKLTAKYVQRELNDADEVNLLDEEDMHVYDLMPLTDPLHLVRCNACRKPIKISQYAAHEEICKSLGITEEMVSELNGATGYKKRPKKERKKLAAAYASTPSEEQGRPYSAKAVIKRKLSCVEGESTIDGSGISPGISDYSTDAIPPPTKRSKLILAGAVDKSDDHKIATGMAKSTCQNTRGATICDEIVQLYLSAGHFLLSGRRKQEMWFEDKTHESRGHLEGSTGGCKQCSDCVGCHKPSQVRGFGLQLQSKEVSALLGKKMFYSLKNHRLRSAVKRMYYESFSEEQSDDVHLNVSQGDEMKLQVPFPTKSHGELKVPMEKGEKEPLNFATSMRKPEQVLADCSDVYMGKLRHIPSTDFSNQDPLNSSLNSQATSLGNMMSNYLPQSFSFAGNSGSSLGTMQQPKGSVPVT